MHIDFLVEEPSIEAALFNILLKILEREISYKIIVHQGKNDLLKKLPGRLRGYSKWISEDYKIVVLVDQDSENCKILKDKISKIVLNSGLQVRENRSVPLCKFQVLVRILVEELESWFLADRRALKRAYPKLSDKDLRVKKYDVPDSIKNSAATLHQLLMKCGYYPSGLEKINNARKISAFMDVSNNLSVSFNQFKNGLIEFCDC